MSHISLRLSFFFGRREYTFFFFYTRTYTLLFVRSVPSKLGFFFLLKEKEKDLRRRVVGWGRPRHLSDPTAQKLKIRLLASYSSPPPPPPASPSQSWLFRRERTSCAPLAVGSDRDHSCSGCLGASNSGGAMWLWKWGGVGARRRRTGRAGCVLLLPAPATSSKHITSPQPGTTIQIRSQYWLITKCIQSFLVFSAKLIQYIH